MFTTVWVARDDTAPTDFHSTPLQVLLKDGGKSSAHHRIDGNVKIVTVQPEELVPHPSASYSKSDFKGTPADTLPQPLENALFSRCRDDLIQHVSFYKNLI